MNNTTRWVASWIDGLGRQREYAFDGPPNRGIARIDFQLKITGEGEKMPDVFDLDEVRPRIVDEAEHLPVKLDSLDMLRRPRP